MRPVSRELPLEFLAPLGLRKVEQFLRITQMHFHPIRNRRGVSAGPQAQQSRLFDVRPAIIVARRWGKDPGLRVGKCSVDDQYQVVEGFQFQRARGDFYPPASSESL